MKKLNQRPVPEAALRDEDAVEMVRVWIAERGLHCSIKVGMYSESTNIPEEKAWGIILADIARHVSKALESGFSKSADVSIKEIRRSFLAEIGDPSSEAQGDFVRKH